MKPHHRSGWCDALSLAAFVGMIASLLLPWYVNIWSQGYPREERFPVPGAIYVLASGKDLLQSLNVLVSFQFPSLVLGAFALMPLFVAWASRHYLIACYFALLGTALSTVFVWSQWTPLKLEWPAWLWCGCYFGLALANAIGWRWRRARRPTKADANHD